MTLKNCIHLFKCFDFRQKTTRLIFFHLKQFFPNEFSWTSDQKEPFSRWPATTWRPGFRLKLPDLDRVRWEARQRTLRWNSLRHRRRKWRFRTDWPGSALQRPHFLSGDSKRFSGEEDRCRGRDERPELRGRRGWRWGREWCRGQPEKVGGIRARGRSSSSSRQPPRWRLIRRTFEVRTNSATHKSGRRRRDSWEQRCPCFCRWARRKLGSLSFGILRGQNWWCPVPGLRPGSRLGLFGWWKCDVRFAELLFPTKKVKETKFKLNFYFTPFSNVTFEWAQRFTEL